ncbi:hypothetical protein QE152_g22405 [Popillia japonica]|uniref:Uncharacterized protein n=1 Tax=Popillia japonica TaxID=7064 RepID=A0AAW1KM83_POPJA
MSRKIDNINSKLERSQEKLNSMTNAKLNLERTIEKHFKEIQSLNQKISQVEIQIEKLVQEAAAKEIKERTRKELAMIKPNYMRL